MTYLTMFREQVILNQLPKELSALCNNVNLYGQAARNLSQLQFDHPLGVFCFEVQSTLGQKSVMGMRAFLSLLTRLNCFHGVLDITSEEARQEIDELKERGIRYRRLGEEWRNNQPPELRKFLAAISKGGLTAYRGASTLTTFLSRVHSRRPA